MSPSIRTCLGLLTENIDESKNNGSEHFFRKSNSECKRLIYIYHHHVKRLFASLFLISVCITQVGKTKKNTERNCFSLYVNTVLEQRIKKSN